MISLLVFIKNDKAEYNSLKIAIKTGYQPTRVKQKINGKTVYRWTTDGDGVVAKLQSLLPGSQITTRISGTDHTHILTDTRTINYILNYLKT